MTKPLTFSLTVMFAVLLVTFTVSVKAIVTTTDFDAESIAIENATYVFTDNKVIAAKLAISFHNQLLETDKDGKFLVVQLDAAQKARLIADGFRLSPATDWIIQRRASLEQLKQSFAHKSAVNDDTIAGYACYSTVEGTYARAELMAQNYPSFANWVDIGDSWTKTQNSLNGYDVKVLQLTNQATNTDAQGETLEKPILFIHSAMHARELATAELTTRFAEHLLANKDDDADIRWILDHHQVHIVFHMNPDGRKKAETGLFWRKNVNLAHCTSDTSSSGVDLNRNFTHFWFTTSNGSSGNECSDVYRGPIAGSEPETQAVENYIRSIFADNRGPSDNDAAPENTTGMHIDVHSHGELILWPWGHRYDVAPNGIAMQTLGRKLAYFNDYMPMQSVGFYPTDGTSDDVSYGELGVAALTFEIGSAFFQNCNVFEQQVLPDNIKALTYAAKVVRAPYMLPSGPQVESVTINGLQQVQVGQGEVIEIIAKLNDGLFSNVNGTEAQQKIAVAEFYVDILPWQPGASANSMTVVDGILGSSIEDMQGQLDTQGMPLGRHTIYVQGQDELGNWGAVSALDFTVVEQSVNQPPEAQLSINCQGANCILDASQSSDNDGSIVEYTWQFGDGSNEVTSDTATMEHSYLVGEYTVMLTVTDDKNAEANTTQVINVTNLTPTVSFTYSCDGGSCTLDGSQSSDSDGAIVEYSWQFGDGSNPVSSDMPIIEHSYLPGEYTAMLTVTDNQNTQASTILTIAIVNVAPVASFTHSCDGGSCSFNGSASTDSDGSVVSYQWQIDGQSIAATSAQVNHNFSQSGNYEVVLTVTDNNESTHSHTENITVTVTTSEPTSTPSPGNSGSGGGGSITWWHLLALMLSFTVGRLIARNRHGEQCR